MLKAKVSRGRLCIVLGTRQIGAVGGGQGRNGGKMGVGEVEFVSGHCLGAHCIGQTESAIQTASPPPVPRLSLCPPGRSLIPPHHPARCRRDWGAAPKKRQQGSVHPSSDHARAISLCSLPPCKPPKRWGLEKTTSSSTPRRFSRP